MASSWHQILPQACLNAREDAKAFGPYDREEIHDHESTEYWLYVSLDRLNVKEGRSKERGSLKTHQYDDRII